MSKETSVLYERAYEEMMKNRPDTKLVFSLLDQGHKLGDPRATYALATWYLFGENVKKDMKKAVVLLKESANKKNPDAMYDLAICYEKGEGVSRDLEIAFELYLKAALRNDYQSFEEVARCYYYGIGVQKDKRIAQIWYDRAEELGTFEKNNNRKTKKDKKKRKKNIIKQIGEFVGKPKLLKIFTSFPGNLSSDGFILGMGKELVLLQVFHDFYCEGYEVLQLSDTKSIESRTDDNFFEYIFREEGIIKGVGLKYNIDLTNLKSLFQSLHDLKKYIIIECEKVDLIENNIITFLVGKIITVNDTSLEFHAFDVNGNWDEKPIEIEYNYITKIQFDTPYINTFIKYVQ